MKTLTDSVMMGSLLTKQGFQLGKAGTVKSESEMGWNNQDLRGKDHVFSCGYLITEKHMVSGIDLGRRGWMCLSPTETQS